MGDCFSKPSAADDGDGAKKTYSWDTRKAVDPKDFEFVGLRGQVVGKGPGAINGGAFRIDNCQDSAIFLMDNMASITVDECTNCRIFIGPVSSSVFVRNCRGCRFVIACSQFRSRDCADLDLLLCCKTLPIIEASHDMRFGCFRGSYFALGGQFTAAGLSVYNNNWTRVHDFSPAAGAQHYSLQKGQPAWLTAFFADIPAALGVTEVDTSTEKCTVPITAGPSPPGSYLLLLFSPAPSAPRKFLRAIAQAPEVELCQTKEVSMAAADVARLVPGADTARLFAGQPRATVLGFELRGPGCESAGGALPELHYACSDPGSVSKIAQAFFAFDESVSS